MSYETLPASARLSFSYLLYVSISFVLAALVMLVMTAAKEAYFVGYALLLPLVPGFISILFSFSFTLVPMTGPCVGIAIGVLGGFALMGVRRSSNWICVWYGISFFILFWAICVFIFAPIRD